MGKIKRYKNGVERFLSGEKGQRFFNFAYSMGAAVVIWGALFKILHLPGGNTLLCVGMGTEVLMFVLTAFDRPESQYHWEEVFPVLKTKNPDDRPNFSSGGGVVINGGATEQPVGGMAAAAAPATVAVAPAGAVESPLAPADAQSLSESISRLQTATEQLDQISELTSATQQYLSQMSTISDQMAQLSATTAQLNDVSKSLLQSYDTILGRGEDIDGKSTGYVDQMEALNRNISGLNTIYEIQLKSISSQLDSIDSVNRGLKDIRDMFEKSAAQSVTYCDETEKMARYMKQLNGVYEKMIKAMTVNMYRPMAGVPGMDSPAGNSSQQQDDNYDIKG